jgi:ubiquinone/menaquinone biosynthesis C-methylase UbiE
LTLDGPESGADPAAEVTTGTLSCEHGHLHPVVGGIPRLLPKGPPGTARDHGRARSRGRDRRQERVRESFSREWSKHELGDRTWYIDAGTYVRGVFLDAVRIPGDELRGKVAVDAGCGNGGQSVALADHVGQVIALDISSGVELGEQLRRQWEGEGRDRTDFIEADLQHPPLRPATADVIYAIGVLHHTPDTHRTFLGLVSLLRPGGTLSVWLYRYEPVVTPILRALRAVTTRLPPRGVEVLAEVMATPFIAFTRVVDRLGVRGYPVEITRREASKALIDIFGAPYAHCHSTSEVEGWFRSAGFVEWWANEGRRGFQLTGRLPPT